MQRSTDNLRAEHGVASQALDALSRIGAHVGEHRGFPAADVAVLLRFLRDFLLGVHVRKEAEVLWPAIALRADEATAAAIGELFRMQADASDLMHSLVLFWEPVDDLSPEEQDGFAAAVAAFVALIRRMQRIEESTLFRQCEAVPPDDQLDWSARFRELERGRMDPASWARRLAPVVRAWRR